MGNTSAQHSKIKVLFLLEAFDKGGIEKVTLDIVNNLDHEKYDITVQTFWYGGHCQSQVNENVKVIPFFFKCYVRGVIRLIQYLPPKILYTLFVKGNYDIEIAASDGGAAKVISGSTNKCSKKICWVHMDVIARGSSLKEFISKETAKKIYDRFDKIVCVSKTAQNRFVEKFGKFPCVTYAHNPLPDKEITEKSKKPAEYDKSKKIFVSVGRLAVEKGFDRLIETAIKLHQTGYSNFQIHIIGDGECRKDLETLIQSNALENVVFLHGFQNNPYPFIANSDFYICSSLDEAFSLSVGESLVLGIPVIGTACSGVDEWLECGKAPYGIRAENSRKGIYDAMLRCLSMSECEYRNFKTEAEQKSKELSMDITLKNWINIMFSEDQCEHL